MSIPCGKGRLLDARRFPGILDHAFFVSSENSHSNLDLDHSRRHRRETLETVFNDEFAGSFAERKERLKGGSVWSD